MAIRKPYHEWIKMYKFPMEKNGGTVFFPAIVGHVLLSSGGFCTGWVWVMFKPIGSMGLVYLPTFTMDGMGNLLIHLAGFSNEFSTQLRCFWSINWRYGAPQRGRRTFLNERGLFFPTFILLVVSIFFYVHPYRGKWSNLTNIFQMGWNHQLVMDSLRG